MLPLKQYNYTLLLVTQQPKSGCKQKPRQPSCPDEPEMGVGWAKWSSSLLQSPKGTELLLSLMPRRRTVPTSVENSSCTLTLEHEKEGTDSRRQGDPARSEPTAQGPQTTPSTKWRVRGSCLFACFPLPSKDSN